LAPLVAGLAIGLAIHYTSRSEKEVEVKTPLGRINWSVLSLPFLWPLVRGMKESLEGSTDFNQRKREEYRSRSIHQADPQTLEILDRLSFWSFRAKNRQSGSD